MLVSAPTWWFEYWVQVDDKDSYRAEVNDIPRQLGHDHLLDVGANLHVVASACGAKVFHSGHLAGESHTPGGCQVG